jgi:hypothetical protein
VIFFVIAAAAPLGFSVGAVSLAALAGCGRAIWLRSHRPDVYQHLDELDV